ncbi:MAG: acetate--CoA ligase family protein [Alphaproteobacteria bacterium]|nr:acetate--CoA ligase family protein [Alphaproteobacteria bacterium]
MTTHAPIARRPLTRLLDPRSVAVIGASDNPARIGGRPLHYLLNGRFEGEVHAVNANRSTVQGVTAYPSILEVPGEVDAVIVAVPAHSVVQTITECAEKGVGAAVIFSSGFAEQDEQGAAWQAELTAISARTGIRLLGPNCLGAFNARTDWLATFSTSVEQYPVQPGPIAIASQSGAFGSHLYTVAAKRGVRCTYWVTTGNESDIEISECIAWYADAPDVGVIAVYAEGVRNGPGLRDALERAYAANKPVIFQKVGRSGAGAEAAASHTASLAGADAVYDALFRQYGVCRVDSIEELLDIALACQSGAMPRGNKLGIMTISGGAGVQMADTAEACGLDVAPMPADQQAYLKELIPFAGVRNPVDITAQALNDMSLIGKFMRSMMDEGGYDAVVAFFTVVAGSRMISEKLIETLRDIREKYAHAPMVLSIVAPDDVVRAYEEAGYTILEDPARAVRAAAAMAHFGTSFERGAGAAPPSLPPAAMGVPDRTVDEDEARRILASAGVPMAASRLATTPGEAAEAWSAIGGPVAMKIVSPDILHKTEIGAVRLDVNSAAEAAQAHSEIMAAARHHYPDARITGVILSEMVTGGVETVLGVISDPVFGPAVMFGLGGVFVEVLGDVTFRIAPFGIDEAHRMIREIRGIRMLEGVRGQPACDIDALARALVNLSVFAAANAGRFSSIDINPCIVLPEGQGVAGVDALIVPS